MQVLEVNRTLNFGGVTRFCCTSQIFLRLRNPLMGESSSRLSSILRVTRFCCTSRFFLRLRAPLDSYRALLLILKDNRIEAIG
jgi:DNA-directed RNA polymerase subunit N (RpoN/RPB10)